MVKMKKKGSSSAASPPIQLIWLTWRLLIGSSIALCLFVFIRLQTSYYYLHHNVDIASFPSSYTHPIRSQHVAFHGNPKLAFLFLARRNLPLDFLWGTFFENGDVANFSIYVHSEPGFVFNESTTRSSFFHNRQLENSIKVAWGESSMIDAERLLLRVALENPSNQRFVLLSDRHTGNVLCSGVTVEACPPSVLLSRHALVLGVVSPSGLLALDGHRCVPLYNFSFVYSYIMASERSFVDSFHDKKGTEERYNPKMSPVIPKNKWRKGSQWITLTRRHAEEVVDDELIFSVFRRFCKRRPLDDPLKGRKNLKLQKQHNCIPDEHYVQTLLAMKNLEGELERRTLTYTQWNVSASNLETKGWHPARFSYVDVSPQQLNRIKDINHVYYETEYRTEWCSRNSTPAPCFLFARKFSPGAAMRLLSLGTVGQFEASALLNSPP